jgi:cobaltochelatase CobN
MKRRITAITWHSYATALRQARSLLEEKGIELRAYSARDLGEGRESLPEALDDLARSDLIYLYRTSEERVWSELDGAVPRLGRPVVCDASDPTLWSLSTVAPPVIARSRQYLIQGGADNLARMITYLASEVLGDDLPVEEPITYPWEGLYHPDAPSCFTSVEDYLRWRPAKDAPTVGLMFYRSYWVNRNLAVENQLIRSFEAAGCNVLPVFCYSVRDDVLGARSSGEAAEEFFFDAGGRPRVQALVKLMSFFLQARARNTAGKEVAADGVTLLQRLGVPIFQPVTSGYRTLDEWAADMQGLGSEVAWMVGLPEFEGGIEPLYVGGVRRDGDLERREPLAERCERLVARVGRWVRMAGKPASERRVAFILHNNPCASVEATVGSGAHLDTLESVARILHRMQQAGYRVEPPAGGRELIETIMDRKAISEFRWTTVDEIVDKGGVLKLVPVEEYRQWFDTLSPQVRERISGAWGNPPGEPVGGMPAAMVYEGKILVTGVNYGHAVVCVQPKRGCAGSRCDGQVCKILHDPDVPPPHQYMATYRYLENDFKVDVVVHVGTHGSLEFLPGKSTGLSCDCYPDMAIGELPHLYIYNADNPPEGTIAKRRSYAVLVDHMQTVLQQGGLYDDLAVLEQYLGEYERVRNTDPARAHALEHLIADQIRTCKLDTQIHLDDAHDDFAPIAARAHELLSIIRNTQIQDGMHIFGELPQGRQRLDLINSILRYDAGQPMSLRRAVAAMMGLDLADLLADQGAVSSRYGRAHGALLEEIDQHSLKFVEYFLEQRREVEHSFARQALGDSLAAPEALQLLNTMLPAVLDINNRIEASLEIESLLSGFEGHYIPSGPSGLITRGRDDVLPTGRNFYTLDPYRIPTRAAWEVGRRLADRVLEKHLEDEGRYPENIAIDWMCSDIMWADGEGLGQMFYLLGVRPLWLSNGRVRGIEVVPLEELGRPRIDLTVRVSGITRDNFSVCMELLDDAICAVAALDEPLEQNYVRKHSLAKLAGAEGEEAWRNATLRIFTSRPGTYGGGVSLAVYASAWKEEQDLADIFTFWNGYAYGRGVFGKEAHAQLYTSLKTVDVTYNKVVTDEYDLLGCCCYFGTHGGMTAAARTASGKEVRTYYGDTREPEHVEVRTLADEVRRVVRTKLLNPKWIEGMKRHGYKGAGDISKRVGRVYGWEATTQEVDDWIFDDITRTFIMDEENRKFFQEHNPWAMEEIARRLLEADARGLWQADPEVLAGLKEYYLEVEGWIEERMGDVKGEFQGGAVDIITADDVAGWGARMREVRDKLQKNVKA